MAASLFDRPLLDPFARPEQVIEAQIASSVAFQQDVRARLAAAESVLNADSVPMRDTASDPIVLTAHPTDRVDHNVLIATPYLDFNKIITVFAALCDEVEFLKHDAATKFYAPLALFGASQVRAHTHAFVPLRQARLSLLCANECACVRAAHQHCVCTAPYVTAGGAVRTSGGRVRGHVWPKLAAVSRLLPLLTSL